MEEPISFWGYKEQESNLILPEHDDDDDKERTKDKTEAVDNSKKVLFHFGVSVCKYI